MLLKRFLPKLIFILSISLLGALLMTIFKPKTFFSGSVNAISGTVNNLNNELLEYINPEKPTHDHSSQYYQRFYISKFNLDNQNIEAKFSSPMKIADGDQLMVAGYAKGNLFQVLAYNNQTQHVIGHENWIVVTLGALFFIAVAIGLLNSELLIGGALVPKLFLFGFTLVSIYMGYRALLIREAIKLISN